MEVNGGADILSKTNGEEHSRKMGKLEISFNILSLSLRINPQLLGYKK